MRRSRGEWVFVAAFAAYTVVAVGLLLLGLLAAFAVDPDIRAMLQGWVSAGGVLAPTWETAIRAARFAETPPEIAIDYLLSAVNVAVGVFLVWRRPNEWVARLFGLGMVGVAMGFNFQAHAIVAIAAGVPARGGLPASFWMQTAHFIYHAVSGGAYLTALLLFPNGRFVPRWTKWLAIVVWGLVLEETFFSVAGLVFGVRSPGVRGFGEGVVPSMFHMIFDVAPLQDYSTIISSEVVYFTLLFGLLVPIVGIGAQVYRYRRASGATERAQTRLVVWALTVAFSLGIVASVLELISFAARGQIFTPDSSRFLYTVLLRITPPLFVVLPIVIGIAVLRYRLFDIEIAVDRTLVYGPLTAVIALLFLGTIFLLQQVLRTLIGGPSELAVALAALINVFLFQPVRRRVQSVVDRRLARGPTVRRTGDVAPDATSARP
jgi:hypothetical protein